MTFLQSITLSALIPIIKTVLGIITPELREKLVAFSLDWYTSARQTPNPWDDIATSALLAILDIPTPTTAEDLAGKLDPSLTQ